MHSREVIFDTPDAAQQRESNQEPALLRALKELLEPDAKWYSSTNLYCRKKTPDTEIDCTKPPGSCTRIGNLNLLELIPRRPSAPGQLSRLWEMLSASHPP
jgi:mediator of RNA polymerase II transcription subunit 18